MVRFINLTDLRKSEARVGIAGKELLAANGLVRQLASELNRWTKEYHPERSVNEIIATAL